MLKEKLLGELSIGQELIAVTNEKDCFGEYISTIGTVMEYTSEKVIINEYNSYSKDYMLITVKLDTIIMYHIF